MFGSIARMSLETRHEILRLTMSTRDDIDALEDKAACANLITGRRPNNFRTTTVWAPLEKLDVELSKEPERITTTAKELKGIVVSLIGTARTKAQAAIQENIMSGDVFRVIQVGYQFSARHSTKGIGERGDALEEHLRTLKSRS
jgi:hypothetical protein